MHLPSGNPGQNDGRWEYLKTDLHPCLSLCWSPVHLFTILSIDTYKIYLPLSFLNLKSKTQYLPIMQLLLLAFLPALAAAAPTVACNAPKINPGGEALIENGEGFNSTIYGGSPGTIGYGHQCRRGPPEEATEGPEGPPHEEKLCIFCCKNMPENMPEKLKCIFCC